MQLTYVRLDVAGHTDLASFEDYIQQTYIPHVFSVWNTQATDPYHAALALAYRNLAEAKPESGRPPSYLLLFQCRTLATCTQLDAFSPLDEARRTEVEVTLRTYDRVQVFDGPGGEAERTERPKCIVAAANEAAAGMEEEMDAWYREEHLHELAKVGGYRRSTRYRLRSAGRCKPPALVDLEQLPPPHLALHEFDDESFDREGLRKPAQTEWSRKIVGGYRRFERDDWRLLCEHGAVGERLGVCDDA